MSGAVSATTMAMIAMAAVSAGSLGYSVSSSQSAMHKGHGEANKMDAQNADMLKALTPEEEKQKAANTAAESRLLSYANMGRSSTILTQGQSLGGGGAGTGDSAPKQLLGL